MRLLALFLTAALMACVGPRHAYACTDNFCLGGGVEVKSNFAVSATYREKAMPGVRVQIRVISEKNAEVWFSGTTDGHGLVHINNLPAGEYRVSTDFLGVSAGDRCFQVLTKPRKPKSKLNFEWGDSAISTQAVAGTLTIYKPGSGSFMERLKHQTREPGAGIPMELTSIRTMEKYQFTSGSDGSFSFPSLPEDTYVLHIGNSTSVPRDGIDESFDVNRSVLAERPALPYLRCSTERLSGPLFFDSEPYSLNATATPSRSGMMVVYQSGEA